MGSVFPLSENDEIASDHVREARVVVRLTWNAKLNNTNIDISGC
jgi:hypothetical protein